MSWNSTVCLSSLKWSLPFVLPTFRFHASLSFLAEVPSVETMHQHIRNGWDLGSTKGCRSFITDFRKTLILAVTWLIAPPWQWVWQNSCICEVGSHSLVSPFLLHCNSQTVCWEFSKQRVRRFLWCLFFWSRSVYERLLLSWTFWKIGTSFIIFLFQAIRSVPNSALNLLVNSNTF